MNERRSYSRSRRRKESRSKNETEIRKSSKSLKSKLKRRHRSSSNANDSKKPRPGTGRLPNERPNGLSNKRSSDDVMNKCNETSKSELKRRNESTMLKCKNEIASSDRCKLIEQTRLRSAENRKKRK